MEFGAKWMDKAIINVTNEGAFSNLGTIKCGNKHKWSSNSFSNL